MKALRTPADPALLAQRYLAATIPALTPADKPTFGLGVPNEWKPSQRPFVGVFDDGGPTRWPVATRPLLRVTVWSDGRTRSRTIAALCMGVLLAHNIPGVASVREPSSLLDGRDPQNHGLMASFTVRTTVRTNSL
ncbi:hypothetical protein ACTHQY_08935 [Rhodococcoides corynebacterioides]|uniref:hypothetical protein n=1 Tax=Rhodococcoides corynebacterioides TaxID=53972 RepID=UPI003F7F5F9D